MNSFHIQQLSSNLTVSLDAVTDTSLVYDPKANAFYLQFESTGNEEVGVSLTPEALQTLALKCIARLPELESPHRVATDTEAIRHPARMILRYDDRSIQLILREVESDMLQAFLWFMKDAALLKRVVANLSRRAAELFMDDLQLNWAGKNPDDSDALSIKIGTKAVSTLLTICRRLTEEGQLPEVTARPEPLPSDSKELSVEEVDALLTGNRTTAGRGAP